jgi:hypothetical protein
VSVEKVDFREEPKKIGNLKCPDNPIKSLITHFPPDEIKLYFTGNTILLPFDADGSADAGLTVP